MGLPLVIFGIGGCAREIAMLVHDINNYSLTPLFDFKGFISYKDEDIGEIVDGYPIISSNQLFSAYVEQHHILGVCLGLANPIDKYNLDKYLSSYSNVVFPNMIHPGSAIPHLSTNYLGHGVVICSGVNITTNIRIGNHVLLNRNSNVGHDCTIGDYCTVNPGAILSGNVKVGEHTLIGAGSTIREKTIIGKNSVIGLGAIIIKDVEDDTTIFNDAAKPRWDSKSKR